MRQGGAGRGSAVCVQDIVLGGGGPRQKAQEWEAAVEPRA